ncbi:MAG: hypothetical protein JXX29_05360, partial [Deltaproteobacteria bacterium]|nr:hypothetical protein [Deltaproteobacteria bacterium]MBN2671076.1 hypothetical protein [Deltaproteobacteria bacterium]
LAKQFETELFQVLESAHAQGMEQVMHAKPDAYRKLIKLSGSFLQNSLRVGLISKDGTLHAERYVPQLLFRKRWRMLGDLPFLYQFLDIEAVADAAYQLQFGNPRNVDIRLKAAERVGEQDSRFDVDVAKALVLYQGKESKRALLYLENVLKNRPDDFVINEFHLFLSNDTK